MQPYPIVTKGLQPQARGRLAASAGTFRREIVDLHRAIFRRNQQRINASVVGYTQTFRRYEAEYHRAVRHFTGPASLAELDAAVAAAQVVYVGDYHTLPQAQRSFLRLLRRLPLDRPVTVALEFVQGRHQSTIDAYLAGRISERAFLRDIEHTSHWVFGGWPSFKEIFALCGERGYRMLGIDSLGRGPPGRSLSSRDAYAARRMASALLAEPRRLVVALVGELHLAPSHLPAALDAQLAARGSACRRLILYQNCQDIYWRLEERGLEHDVELVRIAEDQFCLNNTPPIVCQQSFLNWLEVDADSAGLDAPVENFKEYARLVASFFDLDIGDALDDVEVATVADLSFLHRLRRRGDFSAADMRAIRRQILSSDSYYIPRAKTVYLGNLSVNHAAEEATHFVRHACGGLGEPQLLVDAFYARCMEEALGFLGSKLVNHKRKCPTLSLFEKQARSRTASRRDRTLARLVLRHARMEAGERVRGMRDVYQCSADLFNAVTHVVGYRLGERLYYALVGGDLAKHEIRSLFVTDFAEEGAALASYLYLVGRTARVRVPKRI